MTIESYAEFAALLEGHYGEYTDVQKGTVVEWLGDRRVIPDELPDLYKEVTDNVSRKFGYRADSTDLRSALAVVRERRSVPSYDESAHIAAALPAPGKSRSDRLQAMQYLSALSRAVAQRRDPREDDAVLQAMEARGISRQQLNEAQREYEREYRLQPR